MTPAEEQHLRSLAALKTSETDGGRRIGKKLLRKLLAALDAARSGQTAAPKRTVAGRCSFCGATGQVVDVQIASICGPCAAAACTDLGAYDDALLKRVVRKAVVAMGRGRSLDSDVAVSRVVASCTSRVVYERRDGSVRFERDHKKRVADPAPWSEDT